MPEFKSKLPNSGKTIFSIMSAMANEHKAINLGQGFPNFDCPDELKALITKHLEAGKNQYAPMPGILPLREILAAKMNKMYGCDLNGQTNITITAGATQALFTSITSFVQKEDEVIIIEPAYDSYRPTIEIAGGKPIPYILKGPDFKIDWENFESLMSPQTKMVIINTPHNPTGMTLNENDIFQLERICSNSNAIILSDEVYEHLIYDGEEHQSILKYPGLRERSMAVYSFGKTFHSTGWKIGYCVGPETLMKEFRKIHQWNVFSVNSFIQYALAEYLETPDHYLQLASFFENKRNLFLEAIEQSNMTAIPSKGTYFQLCNYSSISESDDISFCKWITKEKGVAAIPISVFYTDSRQDKLIRFCFAKTDELLMQAAERLITL